MGNWMENRRMKKIVYLDIMINGRFFTQLTYEYCPLFPIEEKELYDFVISKRPTLKDKKFFVLFSNNKV